MLDAECLGLEEDVDLLGDGRRGGLKWSSRPITKPPGHAQEGSMVMCTNVMFTNFMCTDVMCTNVKCTDVNQTGDLMLGHQLVGKRQVILNTE